MPITYAGGEMRHPADRVAKRLGPAAAEIWEMVKVDCPRTARSWMEKGGLGHVKSSLRTLQRAETEWVRSLEEQGMDRTSAELQARKWTSEGLVATEEELSAAAGGAETGEESEEEAFQNLAPASYWERALSATPEEHDREMQQFLRRVEEENAQRDRERRESERRRSAAMQTTT